MNINLSDDAAEIFDQLQRIYDATDSMPTLSDGDVLHLALLALRGVTQMSPETTAREISTYVVLSFEASKSR